MNTYLIFDGNNVAMRAIHAAVHSQMSHEGINTGPLTIFINSITSLIRQERPTHLAVAWDDRENYRHLIDADYKASRRAGPVAELREEAFPQFRRFFDAARIEQALVPHHEADDLIAAWWHAIDDPHAKIVIASSDKDFLQLVGPNPHGVETELVRLSSANTPTDRWTADRVRQDLGYEPANWPLITSLTGDTADDVVGIPGIGPKRALKLLERFDWDLQRALDEYDEYRMQVLQNRTLVDLRTSTGLRLDPPARVNLVESCEAGSDKFLTFLLRYGLAGAEAKWVNRVLWRDAEELRPGRPLRPTQRGS